jgi:hypothetical protein
MEQQSISEQHPFLSWVIGTSSIATSIYIVFFSPYLLPVKIVVCFVLFLTIVGRPIASLMPTRYMQWPHPSAVTFRSLESIIIVIITHIYHPIWLSGSWYGWVSPVFPLLGLLVLSINSMRLLRRW